MLNALSNILKKIDPESTTEDAQTSDATKDLKKKYGDLSGKAGLVIHGMLKIHSNITDNEALQGYEGLPLQLERIMWEVYGILAKNPNIKTPEEINEEWMESYADGWVAEEG